MFGLFKKKREFLPFDIVVPVHQHHGTYYKIGLVQKVIHRRFWTDQVVVEYFFKNYSPLGNAYKLQRIIITYEDPAHLQLYQIKERLIRPLREGDQFFLSKETNIFVLDGKTWSLSSPFHRRLSSRDIISLDLFEKPQTIERICTNYENSAQSYFISLNLNIAYRWLPINIDIPRTNRLLMKEFQPKPYIHLPEL